MPTTPPPGHADRTKVSLACARCRRLKVKCRIGPQGSDGPCLRCDESKQECLVVTPSPLGPNLTERMSDVETKYKDLEELVRATAERCRRLEEQLSSGVAESDDTSKPGERRGDLNGDLLSPEVLRFSRIPRALKRRRLYPEQKPELIKLAFDIFARRCCVSVPFLDPLSSTLTPVDVKSRSLLLHNAIVAVGSREAEELDQFHQQACEEAISTYRLSLGDVHTNIYDLMGVCVVMAWLLPLQPPGHAVGLAYELHLFDVADPPLSTHAAERLRLWAHVVYVDALISLAVNRPALVSSHARGDIVRTTENLLKLADPRSSDIRLVALLEIVLDLSKYTYTIRENLPLQSLHAHFDPKTHVPIVEAWQRKWLQMSLSLISEDGVFSTSSSIHMLYHSARLTLSTFALRGLDISPDLNAQHSFHVQEAILHASNLLRTALQHFQPPIILYTSEYTHINITFAAAFLLKMVEKIPDALDVQSLITLVEEVKQLLGNIFGQSHSQTLGRMLEEVQKKREDLAVSADWMRVEDLWQFFTNP